MAVETGLMTLHEDELQGILQVLAQIARTNDGAKEKLDPGSFQSRLSTLPRRARFTVSQALSALAAQALRPNLPTMTLLKLADCICGAVCAGELRARRPEGERCAWQMLDEMNTELDGLRKILGVYEGKMASAGIHMQTHQELLAHEFWTQVPDERNGRQCWKAPDAWCVPGAIRVARISGKRCWPAGGETDGVEKSSEELRELPFEQEPGSAAADGDGSR